MDLNWKHVIIWNIIAISFIIIGLITKQEILINIGFVGEFAQSLPIVIWAMGQIFPDEQPNLRSEK